jgi:hypothetical protein
MASMHASMAPSKEMPEENSMIVVDCGSSGTRIYHVGRDKNRILFCKKIGAHQLPKIDKILPRESTDPEYEKFIDDLKNICNSLNASSFVLGASAGLRAAKASGTVTDEDVQRFRHALPETMRFSEVPEDREAELEFIVGHCLVEECFPFFCSSHFTSAGMGMVSMGGRSMQFVRQSPPPESKVVCKSIPFAAHSACEFFCPFHREVGKGDSKKRGYPDRIVISDEKIEEMKEKVSHLCREMQMPPMEGLILGITGCAKVAEFCDLEGKLVNQKEALIACDIKIKMIRDMEWTYGISYEKPFGDNEAELLGPFRSTLGALAKTLTLRHVLSLMMSDNSETTRLFCMRKWKQRGTSPSDKGMDTEWSLGPFVEREKVASHGGQAFKTLSGNPSKK